MSTKASDQNIVTIKKIVSLVSNGCGLIEVSKDSNKKIIAAKKIPKGRHAPKCLMHVYSVTIKNSAPNKITGNVWILIGILYSLKSDMKILINI